MNPNEFLNKLQDIAYTTDSTRSTEKYEAGTTATITTNNTDPYYHSVGLGSTLNLGFYRAVEDLKKKFITESLIIKELTRNKDKLELVETEGKSVNFISMGMIYNKNYIEKFKSKHDEIYFYTYLVKHNEIVFYFEGDMSLIALIGKNFDEDSLARLIEVLLATESKNLKIIIPKQYENKKAYTKKIKNITEKFSAIFG